jgi:hypothetical protein
MHDVFMRMLQARGITMKSSSICLLHIPGTGSKPHEIKIASAEDKLNNGAQQPACSLSINALQPLRKSHALLAG